MKDELIEKVTNLYSALRELNELWREMDWSIVPDVVHENYPYREDLLEMESGTRAWLDAIKKA